jgi:hypothetical protein
MMVSDDELTRKWWTIFITQGSRVEVENCIMARGSNYNNPQAVP